MRRFRPIRWSWCLFALALATCTPGSVDNTNKPDTGEDTGQGTPIDDSGRTLPAVQAAQAISRHYVEVVFASPVDIAAEDASRYRITGPSNESLEVRAARRSGDLDRVILTTSRQAELLYKLEVLVGKNTSAGSLLGTAQAPLATILFKGSALPEPYIASALALDNTTVLVTFSEVMDDNATAAASYRIESPDLAVLSATRGTSTTVQLTTASQEQVEYQLRAVNLTAGNGTRLIDPDSRVSFQGNPPVDNTAPRLLAAAVLSDTTILLSFSEPLADGMNDPIHFTISPSLLVSAAALSTYNTQILLTTLPMQAGLKYRVTVAPGIQDKAGNLIEAGHDTATFTFNGQTTLDGADILPRVIGAIATSNTGVRVTFSKAMGEGLEVEANYSITGADTSFLLVTNAKAGPDRIYVDLTTSSQAPGMYTVHVVNVLDSSGNPLMAPSGLLAPPEGVDPASATFRAISPVIDPGPDGSFGTGDDVNEHIDSDGDNFADWFETQGWFITVKFANGTASVTHVTSDPYSPDTDGDGLDDSVENQWSLDPRTDDTDADHLTDGDEFNVYYSDPSNQDTDGDGIGDFLEVDFFRTSPILADTDGDQFNDARELFESSRNPLLSDLPVPQITVGGIRLDLEITSSFTDEQGTTTEVRDSSSTSFAQSRSNTLSTSSTTSTEAENNFSQKLGFELGGSAKEGFEGKVTGEAGFEQSRSQGFSSTVDSENAKSSQQEWERSVENALSKSQNRSVTRNIESALIQATVNLANRSDVAFSITNLEISVLQQDRQSGLNFQPIATLRPSGDSTPTFNLGPLDGERGPIIFESTSVFPNLVDSLMREPTGLVFKVVNFDIFDELGRNFAFSSQEVIERTAGIEIDYGNGVVEKFRVATASTFDANGLAVGITLQRGLEIAGLTRAAGDDPPLPPGPLTPALRNSYGTYLNTVSKAERLTRVRGVQNDRSTIPQKRFWAVLVSNPDLPESTNFSDIPLRAGDKVQLWFTSDADDDKLFAREEYLYGSKDDDTDTDDDGLGDFFEIRTGWTVNRLPGLPYKAFPDPARPDSDLDGLTDKQESTEGTDPHRADTDEDGIPDKLEIQGPLEVVLFDGDANEKNDVILTIQPYQSTFPIIQAGPNGILNSTVAGDDIASALLGRIVPGPNGVLDTVPSGDDYIEVAHARLFATDPLNRDTDGDGLPDGRELILGTNPNSQDAGRILDSDHDGLSDNEEDQGWTAKVNGADIHVTSNKLRDDTDLDGLPDVYERAIGSNPRLRDTDGDNLSDFVEFDPADQDNYYNAAAMDDANRRCQAATNCTVPTAPSTVLRTNITKADTDADTIRDDVELSRTWFVQAIGPDGTPLAAVEVSSKPYRADDDGDGLGDAEEFAHLTNPSDGDSDTDETDDGDETATCFDVDGNPATPSVCRNPLVADRLIKFQFTNFTTVDDCDDTGYPNAEISKGYLYLVDPLNNETSYQIPGTLSGVCLGEDTNHSGGGDGTIGSNVALSFTKTFFMATQQTFVVKNDPNMTECDAGSEDPLQPTSITFTYTMVAAFPPNGPSTPATEFVINAAPNANPQGGCQFKVLMQITSMVTPK